MKQLILDYFTDLQKQFGTGRAREHSYRHALKKLIEEIDNSVIATNEPSRVKCGAPDYVITRKDIPIGYGEAKDVDVTLDEVEISDQIKRYHVLGNLFVTNYLEFRFFLNGEKYETIRIGKNENGLLIPDESAFDQLALVLKDFTRKRAATIKSAKRLAEMMADKARLMKEIIYKALKDEENPNSTLHDQLTGFQKVLIDDMDESQFADIYAQTIAYGLFVARFHDDTPENFSRREAEELVPKSNPFLRKLFHYIAGPDLDDRIAWIVDALADVFLHTDIKEILKEFGKSTKQDDPIIHFYETFLAAYDSKLRKSRGVYYTPEPIVSFIVRSVDEILKKEFNLPNGLADTSKTTIDKEVYVGGRRDKKNKYEKRKYDVHKVQILDPAVGTGTFLNEVIKHIHKKFEGQEGRWPSYVDEHLLPRLHGFELMMAPYTMCHLKLGLTLAQTGYKEGNKRLGVYLTNSLEESHEDYETLFATWLSEESNEASRIKKEMPIMVVMGNPPYSVSSANKGEWIRNLIEDYKKDLNERNIQPLSDDYIKFLRYAQYNIEKTGYGIVGMITNNSFIDGIIHRRMRESLLTSFDKIYIYDLHGNAKKKEVCPNGSKDENVFDIMQGVSISLFVKTSKSEKLAQVFHYDSYGLRNKKYEELWNKNVENTEWKKLKAPEPYFFFVKKDFGPKEKYNSGFKISEIFNQSGSGIKFRKDNLLVKKHFDRKSVKEMLQDINNLQENEILKKYNLKETNDWKLKEKSFLFSDWNEKDIQPVNYRPFDIRFTYYPIDKINQIIVRGDSRVKLMKHILGNKNYGLITSRQFGGHKHFICFCSKHLIEISSQPFAPYHFFPLYLYPDNQNASLFDTSDRKPNLNPEIITQIAQRLGMHFIEDGAGDGRKTFGPEDVLDYIYSVLHSPSYREKYKEFLKIDFPRVPFTEDKKVFWQCVKLGHELKNLHLLESEKIHQPITGFPVAGNNVVEKIKFEGEEKGKVWFNDSQYFDKAPRVAWEFYIGGYQPAQKWLKDRKGRKLSNDDIEHYQKIIVALTETDRVMKEVDGVTRGWV